MGRSSGLDTLAKRPEPSTNGTRTCQKRGSLSELGSAVRLVIFKTDALSENVLAVADLQAGAGPRLHLLGHDARRSASRVGAASWLIADPKAGDPGDVAAANELGCPLSQGRWRPDMRRSGEGRGPVPRWRSSSSSASADFHGRLGPAERWWGGLAQWSQSICPGACTVSANIAWVPCSQGPGERRSSSDRVARCLGTRRIGAPAWSEQVVAPDPDAASTGGARPWPF